jgi:hypothetical protein
MALPRASRLSVPDLDRMVPSAAGVLVVIVGEQVGAT